MIQFNLLPDVKMEYIKARRTKRTVVIVSVIVSAAAISLFVLLFLVVNVFQKQHLSDLNRDINDGKKTLQSKPDLGKVLTIQNQLNSLPDLHKQKPVVSRTFGYIQQVTPANASISTLELNYADQTVKIEGSADSLATVNTFVDTMKFTTFTASNISEAGAKSSDPAPAFMQVVLSEFAVAPADQKVDKNKAVTYTITLKYDPTIFDSQKTVSLVVAKKITTRSETEKPAAIFQAKPTTEQGGAQ